MSFDVAIVGGGLVGAACADALAGAGASVGLFEAGPFLRESSWAGAGILHPIHPWNYDAALQPLLRRAVADYPATVADLRDRTGIDPELERSGLLVMGVGGELDRLAGWCGEGIEHAAVPAAREDDPAIREAGAALLLPEARHIRSHLLGRAFLEGARRRGATLHEYRPVTALGHGFVEVAGERVAARRTLLCAGAWSGRLRPGLDIEPVRGQILLYRGRMRRMVVFPGGEYAVPRRDGRILFGSTLEKAGFAGRPTAEAVSKLAGRAHALLGLEEPDLLAVWAGLRPGTESLLPRIGPDPDHPGLVHACGHYRNGILLAPLTARLVTTLLAGGSPEFDLRPFSFRA